MDFDFNCGFTTELKNGLTVSVQFHDGALGLRDDDGKLVNVEMACWKTDKDKLWLSSDVWPEECQSADVVGYVHVNEVMHLIDAATQMSARYVDVLANQRATAPETHAKLVRNI